MLLRKSIFQIQRYVHEKVYIHVYIHVCELTLMFIDRFVSISCVGFVLRSSLLTPGLILVRYLLIITVPLNFKKY